MAKIDVIIPMYNASSMISETIESVEASDFNDFKIIIVDDGSTDDSCEIVGKLGKKYDNIYYYKKENGGVSAARNFGISKSTSPYICFLDSDDLYDRKYLSKMYKKIEQTNSDLCTCGYNELIDGEVTEKKSSFVKSDFLVNYLITKNKLHISNFLIKKEIILDNDIIFHEQSSYGEDIEFMVRIIKNSKKIEIVPEYLTYYRIETNRLSLSSFSLEKIEDDIEFSNRLLNDKSLHLSKREKEALINHKLVGNIVNKLLEAINLGYNKDEIRETYNKYEYIINKKSHSFGLRSLKLSLKKQRLKSKIGY
ncbi:MAG: glycosyltransferase family A protein [Anaerococcus sp.]|uniref:glycosyltransferase family 2 protein n=1 Tax=Anaerococcus sp. TaxID=1872515 RepID=UPI0029007E48|nr:glycosyltransferase family A protein [Anaerococcus sp.]MDU2565152.1 glycosyltransferase family A protein [Anaerococcus sp.]